MLATEKPKEAGYQIRRATLEDAERVFELLVCVARGQENRNERPWTPTAESREMYRKSIEAGDLWIVETDGPGDAIVAMVELTENSRGRWDKGKNSKYPALYLRKFATHPAYAGRGIGAFMAQHAKYLAGPDRRVRLETALPHLRALYLGLGFKQQKGRWLSPDGRSWLLSAQGVDPPSEIDPELGWALADPDTANLSRRLTRGRKTVVNPRPRGSVRRFG